MRGSRLIIIESFLKKAKEKAAFTLVELIVAMAISGIVAGGLYTIYLSQQRSFATQEQMVRLQEKMRAALYFMAREVSMAGCDPTGEAGAGIILADSDQLRFTEDIDGDGDIDEYNEDIEYSLYKSGGVQKLGRRSPSTAPRQPVAEHIDALDFVYLDKDGNTLSTPLSEEELSKIRSIEITIVGRSEGPDPNYVNTNVYKNQQGETIFGPPNDHYRRLLLSVEVFCRNLAFKGH